MLRMYFLQHWFNLSDPAVEEALSDKISMRAFAPIDLGESGVPDETTICKIPLPHREARPRQEAVRRGQSVRLIVWLFKIVVNRRYPDGWQHDGSLSCALVNQEFGHRIQLIAQLRTIRISENRLKRDLEVRQHVSKARRPRTVNGCLHRLPAVQSVIMKVAKHSHLFSSAAALS
jgi:hypothetical protein